jgi:hypothetical protein
MGERHGYPGLPSIVQHLDPGSLLAGEIGTAVLNGFVAIGDELVMPAASILDKEAVSADLLRLRTVASEQP